MIRSLRLTNFKNFQDATLELGKLTLLVGTNASGKSNLRDAFRLLHGIGRGYTLAEIFGEKWGEGGELQWHGIRGGTLEATFRRAQTLALECRFEILGSERTAHYRIEVEAGSNGRAPQVHAEQLLVEGHREPVYLARVATTGRAPTERHLLVVHLPKRTPRKSGGKPDYIAFPNRKPVLDQLSADEVAKRDARILRAAQWTLRVFRSMRFFDLHPEAMRLPSVPGQVVLGDRGENLSSVLQAICETEQDKQALLEWVRQLTPLDVQDFDFVADQTGRILLTLVETGGQRTSAYSASDGTLRFLAVIAAMLGPDPARLYFFEELDTGIHPTRLHLLLQLIEQTVSRKDIQVIGTTHCLLTEPGEGRTTMGREAASKYPRVRSRCKEDIEALEAKLKSWLGTT